MPTKEITGDEETGEESQRKERMVDFVRLFLDFRGSSSSSSEEEDCRRLERESSVIRVSVGVSGQGDPFV